MRKALSSVTSMGMGGREANSGGGRRGEDAGRKERREGLINTTVIF